MRLTNVSQMMLPQGTLQTFGVHVAASPENALPVSFDQRRHVGAGERPGSWMAISSRISAEISPDRLASAWMRVVETRGAEQRVLSQ